MSSLVTPLGRVIPRHAERLVVDALKDTRVVLINGARQAGKSTLTSLVAREATFLRLDRDEVRAAAERDPAGTIDAPGMIVIDEIQRAPGLLLAIKDQVDSNPRPGRFLLTGSVHVLGLNAVPDALPGRLETIELWPFSQGELGGTTDNLADAIFSLPDRQLPQATGISRRDLAERIARGGFPEAVARVDPRRRRRFLSNYVQTLIDRDIRELSDIERGGDLRRMLQAVAARTGQLLVTEKLCSDLKITARTARRYLGLCEDIYLIKKIPAWSSNLARRPVATPKVAFVDSAVAAYLLGQDASRLANPLNEAFGWLLEGFVLMELARQLTWAENEIRMFHYRTKDKVEVDAVLETSDGRVAGIEVKGAATVRDEDFRGLRLLQRHSGTAFAAGVVLYAGRSALSFGPRLKALPVSALWEITS